MLAGVLCVRIARWFLAVTYGIGAPLTAYLEYSDALFSERFGYPPELIYLTCVVQIACSVALFVPRLVRGAAVVLTVITLGAVVSHWRIGSPQTSIAALVYTGVQVWVGFKSRV